MIIYAKFKSSRLRHQYGIFCGELQMSFMIMRNATWAGSEEGWLFSQASHLALSLPKTHSIGFLPLLYNILLRMTLHLILDLDTLSYNKAATDMLDLQVITLFWHFVIAWQNFLIWHTKFTFAEHSVDSWVGKHSAIMDRTWPPYVNIQEWSLVVANCLYIQSMFRLVAEVIMRILPRWGKPNLFSILDTSSIISCSVVGNLITYGPHLLVKTWQTLWTIMDTVQRATLKALAVITIDPWSLR